MFFDNKHSFSFIITLKLILIVVSSQKKHIVSNTIISFRIHFSINIYSSLISVITHKSYSTFNNSVFALFYFCKRFFVCYSKVSSRSKAIIQSTQKRFFCFRSFHHLSIENQNFQKNNNCYDLTSLHTNFTH